MKNNLKKILPILFFLFVIIFIIHRITKESRENKLLESYDTTTAILIKTYQGTPKSPSSGDFVYRINDKEYTFSQSGNYYKYMNVGDTVLIKYAIEDHSVARVIESFYMEKYKHLRR